MTRPTAKNIELRRKRKLLKAVRAWRGDNFMNKNFRTFKCDQCGKFIPMQELMDGIATHRLVTPDSFLTKEEYITLCKDHSHESSV